SLPDQLPDKQADLLDFRFTGASPGKKRADPSVHNGLPLLRRPVVFDIPAHLIQKTENLLKNRPELPVIRCYDIGVEKHLLVESTRPGGDKLSVPPSSKSQSPCMKFLARLSKTAPVLAVHPP